MTAPKPMDPGRLALLRIIASKPVPGETMTWCLNVHADHVRELLADRDRHAAEVESRGALLAEWQLACGRHQRAAFDAQAEVERLRPLADAATSGTVLARFEVVGEDDDRELMGWTEGDKQESAHHSLAVDPANWPLGTIIEVRAGVSPRASEGAATPRVPHGGPASMWPQVSEHAAENGDDPTLCECGNLGECIGQFEGETRPALGCPGCCKHDDMGAGGRCWPIVWGAATPTPAEHVLERWGPLLALLGEGPGGES